MADINFNLIELYTKVFGIKGVRFAISSDAQASKRGVVEYNSLNLPALPKARAYSVLGTPIYEQITLKTSNREYTFPDWPLIDISASKNIVTTAIKGRNGSVKEYINIDDYQVNIRGILINYESDDYPEDLVYDLHETFKLKTEMQVTSPVMNLLDIHNLVIKDIKIPEVEGYNNIQPYLLQCLSDEPIELVIKDAKNQNKIIKGL